MLSTLLLTAVLLAAPANADAPNVDPALAAQAQTVMNEFITARVIDGKYYLYDTIDNRMLKLELDYLHEGVKQKGEFFVSCADFVDQDGRKIDVDYFAIVDGNGGMVVTQAFLHKIDGVKRPYKLASR